jgi:hypothetical protein
MCHPGLPSPHGLGHLGSLGLLAFHNAKSFALLFSYCLSTYDSPSPSYSNSVLASGLIFGYACLTID